MERRLAAILVADVVGYSRMMGENEAQALGALQHLRDDLFEPEVASRSGKVIKRIGDGWLVEFESAVEAVSCALGVQDKLVEKDIALRIGIHIGDIVHEGDDIFGNGVNVAARLEAVAGAGQIVISNDVRRLISGLVSRSFCDNGVVTLKNIIEPVWIWSWPDRLPVRAADPDRIGQKPRVFVGEFETILSEAQDVACAVREDLSTMFSRQTALVLVDNKESADYLVGGSVRSAGPRYRVVAHLTHRATGEQVWSERYDETDEDVFRLQDQCGIKIASSVRVRISINEARYVDDLPLEKLTVEQLLNVAAHCYMSTSPEIWLRARQALELVLQYDPDNWMAYAMLCYEATSELDFGWRRLPDEDAVRTSRYIERAVRLNPNSDVVRMTHAKVLLAVKKDHAAAKAEAELALKLNKNFMHAVAQMAMIEAFLGNAAAAMKLARQAVEDDASHPYLFYFLRQAGISFAVLGQYDQAAEYFMKADLAAPGLPANLIGLAASRQLLGNTEGARDTIATLTSIAPQFNLHELEAWPFKDPFGWVPIREALEAAGARKMPLISVVGRRLTS